MTQAYNGQNGGKKKKEGRPAPLSLKIFRAFAVFTLIIIVVLWLFQAVFFDAVYKTVKRHDMKNCTENISEAVEDGKEATDDAVLSASKKYNCCVSVYQVSGQSGERIAYSHIQTNCMIHNLGSDALPI